MRILSNDVSLEAVSKRLQVLEDAGLASSSVRGVPLMAAALAAVALAIVVAELGTRSEPQAPTERCSPRM